MLLFFVIQFACSCHVIPFFVCHMTLCAFVCVWNNDISCFQWFVYCVFCLQTSWTFVIMCLNKWKPGDDFTTTLFVGLVRATAQKWMRTNFNIILTGGIVFLTNWWNKHSPELRFHTYNCICKTSVAQIVCTFILENWQSFRRLNWTEVFNIWGAIVGDGDWNQQEP